MDSVQIFWLINASLTLIYVTMQQDLSSQTEWRIVKCLFINNLPLFYFIEMFIDFNLNQLYWNTPFKENETWCTHTETHFLWNFYETRRNCFFNACFYHSLWKHTDIFHDTKCMKVHARSSGTKYLYYLTNQLYCHWLFPTIFNIRYCQLSSSRNLSKPIMNLIYFAGKHKDTWIQKILVSRFLYRLRVMIIR